MTPSRSLPVMVLAALVASIQATAQGPGTSLSRTVYLSVADKSGTPVDDLTADDLEIKEGGKTVEVTQVARATEPLQIALIVDDNGTGIFRSGLARFVQRMQGHAVMSLSAVTGQTMKLVDYTPDAAAILTGVQTLSARPGTPDGGQLLEGISEAAQELRHREAHRPVIIAMTVGGEEHSTADSDHVLDQLRQSGAILHVFTVESSALRSTIVAQRPSALLQENLQLSRVLGDGPKQSGGRNQSIVASPGILMSLQNLAGELTSQYRVTYSLPAGAKRSQRLNVSARRQGLTIRAPSKLPN